MAIIITMVAIFSACSDVSTEIDTHVVKTVVIGQDTVKLNKSGNVILK